MDIRFGHYLEWDGAHLIHFVGQVMNLLAAIGGKVSKSPDRILRQRRKETFINKWRLVTVPIPSYVNKQLVTDGSIYLHTYLYECTYILLCL